MVIASLQITLLNTARNDIYKHVPHVVKRVGTHDVITQVRTLCLSIRLPTVSLSPPTGMSSASWGSALYSQSLRACRASVKRPENNRASSSLCCLAGGSHGGAAYQAIRHDFIHRHFTTSTLSPRVRRRQEHVYFVCYILGATTNNMCCFLPSPLGCGSSSRGKSESGNSKVAGSIPGLCLARGVPEQDTT